MENKIESFKNVCRLYLDKNYGTYDLRPYARSIGVKNPTKDKKKEDLIEAIIAVLVGDVEPVPPSKLGAPVLNTYFDPNIPIFIEKLRAQYLNEETDDYNIAARLKELKKNEFVLTVEDPNKEDYEKNGIREIVVGQFEEINDVLMLLPLDCSDTPMKTILSSELAEAYNLRIGDVVSCYTEKRNNAFVVSKILTINGLMADSFHRIPFETCTVAYPKRRLHFYDGKDGGSLSAKTLEWLLPIGKGQRALVFAPPKAGKSNLLLEIARTAEKCNDGLKVLTVLIDQSPENVGRFRTYCKDGEMVYTTYEDSPERQVFVADFMMNRAKRYAECGNDVLLIVDSFNALARAFNDTDASTGGKVLSGNIESKTVQYLKRYLGAARALERGNTLTIIGSLATDTGNIADDLLKAELSSVANLQIYLDETLARKRIYPAIDLFALRGEHNASIMSLEEENFDSFLRNSYLSKYNVQNLFSIMSECKDFTSLQEKVYQATKQKK